MTAKRAHLVGGVTIQFVSQAQPALPALPAAEDCPVRAQEHSVVLAGDTLSYGPPLHLFDEQR